MVDYVWVHGVESEAEDALAAINTFLGLPNGAASKWADVHEADSAEVWFYQDGSYPVMTEGEWVRVDIRGALEGFTIVEYDTPEDLAAVMEVAVSGMAVRVPWDKAVEFGFWPEVVVNPVEP
jgi:hypothetical protein